MSSSEMMIEDIGDIIICVIALAIAVATDYLHTAGISFISSAIPLFIFQLLMMANTKVKKNNEGKGILKWCWDKLV